MPNHFLLQHSAYIYFNSPLQLFKTNLSLKTLNSTYRMLFDRHITVTIFSLSKKVFYVLADEMAVLSIY